MPLLLLRFDEDWSSYSSGKTERAEFSVGRRFLDLNGTDAVRLYRYGRVACVPFSIIGALAVYFFARDLYGNAAGLVGLSLWCFSPSILGNGAIITPDVPAAALAVLATYQFWRWLCAPVPVRCVVAGLALGLAQLAKMTCVVLYVALPLMWFISYAWYSIGRERVSGR